MNKSWKTSATGITGIIIAVLTAAQAMLDNNPATNPDWSAVIVAITMGLGLISARDNNVTSEQAGAKPLPPISGS